MSRYPGKLTDKEEDSAAEQFDDWRRDQGRDGQTWNTCPECFRRWQDATPTPDVLHRTRLCVPCAAGTLDG